MQYLFSVLRAAQGHGMRSGKLRSNDSAEVISEEVSARTGEQRVQLRDQILRDRVRALEDPVGAEQGQRVVGGGSGQDIAGERAGVPEV